MIITLFLNFIYLFITGIESMLPHWSMPASIVSSFAYFVGVVNQFNYVVPVAALFEAIAVVTAIDLAIMLWHLLNWAMRKVPGIN